MVPLLFAVGSLLALRLGFYQKHVVLALFVAGFIGLSLVAAFRVAAVVRRADVERRAAEWAEADMALSERLLAGRARRPGAALRRERAADPGAAGDPESRARARAEPGRPDPVLERGRAAALRLDGAARRSVPTR